MLKSLASKMTKLTSADPIKFFKKRPRKNAIVDGTGTEQSSFMIDKFNLKRMFVEKKWPDLKDL